MKKVLLALFALLVFAFPVFAQSSPLVELSPSTFVLELYRDNPKTYYVVVTSNLLEAIDVNVEIDESLQSVLVPHETSGTVLAGGSKTFSFTARSAVPDFNEVVGSVGFRLNETQSLAVSLRIRSVSQPDFFESIFGVNFLGVPAVFFVVFIFVIGFLIRKPK